MSTPSQRLTPEALCRLMDIPYSSQQLDAITAPLDPAVVVAGAGSGKTSVMAARVVWLVGIGAVSPDQVLGLTFTNKAAAELRSRMTAALSRCGLGGTPPAAGLPDEAPDAQPTVLTYHAYAGQLLREHAPRIGHEPDVTLLSDASRFQLAERAVRRHRGRIDHLPTSVPHVVRSLLSLDAQMSDHLVSPDDVRAWQRFERARWEAAKQTAPVRDVLTKLAAREELLGLVEDYRELKSSLDVMDFSDSMALSAMLAETCPDVSVRERASYPAVLLDEYQDTSAAQARLLRALFAGGGHCVTAVGDPFQAIYGWRGASASNLDRFAGDFPIAADDGPRPAPRFHLSINRRSGSRILDSANAVAAPLRTVTGGSSSLTAPPGAPPGQVRAAVLSTYADELDFVTSALSRVRAEQPGLHWSDIAVLVRDNASAADVHDRLVAADIPVEVVGLSGLLALPEVVDVVATLEVLYDATANPALLQLLAGPRWRIGPRDLALLGRQARALSRADDTRPTSLAGALEAAVAGTDPADAVSLLEALGDPGPGRYSAPARARFAELAGELRTLQAYVGEPLLDLVHRVIDTIGIDIELASSTSRLAQSRRDNLAAFVDAIAAFAGAGADASLPGLLAYLRAEEDFAGGLPLVAPSEADSVKVLTVHKAKGLEWEVVLVPGLSKDVFPSRRSRPRWTTAAQELPWPLRGDAPDLPSVTTATRAGLEQFVSSCRAHESLEERRLAYVALTRARQMLVVSGHWWGPTQARPRGPSEFLDDVLASLETRGEAPDVAAAPPVDGSVNPANRTRQSFAWPVEVHTVEGERRAAAAVLVKQARASGWEAAARTADRELSSADAQVVAQWDLEIARLIEEAERSAAAQIVVRLPRSLTATTALRLGSDPDALARDLARPLPRRPSAAARFGTRFHAWVESRFGQQQLVPLDDVPGRADESIGSDAELEELIAAFSAGPFANWAPVRVEAPFALVLAGHAVRGRIDAVYATGDGFLLVDWKTQRSQTADPLQLAIYRTAWAEIAGVKPESVRAAFYYVRSGEIAEPPSLQDRASLEELFGSAQRC